MGCATTNDANANECYNEQFLSIKSRCYNERGGILFTMESSIIVCTRERLFILFHVCSIVCAFREGKFVHILHERNIVYALQIYMYSI